jgi:hypothetical protein
MKNLFWKKEWRGKPFLEHFNFCILWRKVTHSSVNFKGHTPDSTIHTRDSSSSMVPSIPSSIWYIHNLDLLSLFIVIQASYVAYWQFWYHQYIQLAYCIFLMVFTMNTDSYNSNSVINHRLDIANKNTYHLTRLKTASLTWKLQQNPMSSVMWRRIIYRDDRAASPAEMSVHFYTYQNTQRHIPEFVSLLSHHHTSKSYSGHLCYESVNTGVANWGFGGTFCFHI